MKFETMKCFFGVELNPGRSVRSQASNLSHAVAHLLFCRFFGTMVTRDSVYGLPTEGSPAGLAVRAAGHQVALRAWESSARRRPRGLRDGLAGLLGGPGASREQPQRWGRFSLLGRSNEQDSPPLPFQHRRGDEEEPENIQQKGPVFSENVK
jgi:hypothetical protein